MPRGAAVSHRPTTAPPGVGPTTLRQRMGYRRPDRYVRDGRA
jgi:hypothetical protein